MRILFLSQRVPYPPNKGDKLRSYNQLKFLARHHQISLVCLADNNADLKHQAALAAFCKSVDIVYLPPSHSRFNVLKTIITQKPFTLAYFYSSALQRLVDAKLQDESFDLIFVFCSSMAQYVEKVDNLPKVIDFVDVDSAKWSQYALYTKFPLRHIYRMEAHRLKQYETSLCALFQYGFLVSQKEVDDFCSQVTNCPTIAPLPNGVDLESFQWWEGSYDRHRLVFTGAMDYFANVETVLYFYRNIFPFIKERIPDIKFYVVGSNPVQELIELGKKNTDIVVTGWVKKVQPYFQQAAVFVAPMRIARGVQNKILEAMAMGVPVITNSLGAKGVSAKAGVEIIVEDDPQNFAEQVVKLIVDDEKRAEIARNARKAVEERYNWTANLSVLDEVLPKVIKKFRQALSDKTPSTQSQQNSQSIGN